MLILLKNWQQRLAVKMARGILIYAELLKSGYIAPVFFSLAAKAQDLSQKLNGEEVMALLIAKPGDAQRFKEGFQACGIDKVFVYEDEHFENYSNELYSKIAIDLACEIEPSIFLIGATTQGRDLAPRISSQLHTGLTADCTGLDINEKGQLAATRPTFGGKLMATILCKTFPQMATVRPGVFPFLEEPVYKDTQIIYKNHGIENFDTKVKLREFIQNTEEVINSLDSAKIIVAGGKGLKTKEGFELLQQLADTLGGTIAASRGAVDMGLAPQSIQVGQTGKTVSPEIYIACGISGAVQHTVGIEGAKKIIAINIDKDAPIFGAADVGIVGDLYTIVPQLIEHVKQFSADPPR